MPASRFVRPRDIVSLTVCFVRNLIEIVMLLQVAPLLRAAAGHFIISFIKLCTRTLQSLLPAAWNTHDEI